MPLSTLRAKGGRPGDPVELEEMTPQEFALEEARRSKQAEEMLERQAMSRGRLYADRRRAAYVETLAVNPGDGEIDVLGHCLDLVLARQREIEAAVENIIGRPLPINERWEAMLRKIDFIKSEHPKPD